MEEQPSLYKKNLHLQATRKLNSLKLNMSKTVDIIHSLADAIETDTRHIEEDRQEALVFIDQQVDAIKAAKERILRKEETSVKPKEKTDKQKEKTDAQ